MAKAINKKLIIAISLFGSASALAIRNKIVNKRKDSRSYIFQRLLQAELEPEKVVISELYKTGGINNNAVKLNSDEIKKIAENIWDSWGFFNDDEDKVYSQMRLITNNSTYKRVAEEYIILSDGIALDFDLKDRLSADEFKTVQLIINSYEKE